MVVEILNKLKREYRLTHEEYQYAKKYNNKEESKRLLEKLNRISDAMEKLE